MVADIALLPGDGVGTEVLDATVPVLEEIADIYGFDVTFTEYDWGSEWYLEHGEMLPDSSYDQLASHDAILLGAMGHPDVPDHISSNEGHISIRREFDHYVNLRPAYLFDPTQSRLEGIERGDIDIALYRENTEGQYNDIGGRLDRGGQTEIALQTSVYTEEGIERIARRAFEAATERDGKVTNVTKSNALPHGPVFWDEVVETVAEEYPDVAVEHLYVDAAAMDLVRRPCDFDVILASNLFGDILSDLTAEIIGGLGLAPSANLNPDGDYPGMFEPVHGSALDIAGDGIVNPLATILSAELMLEDLGKEEAAAALRSTVEAQLIDDDAPRTPDLGGDAMTEDVINDLCDRLHR
jgi:tartrate dehydrogenase/decarboxylase/D-malate dehydrogenase